MSFSGSGHDLLELDGKVAVVTGAAGGIGSAVTALLVEAGARVVAVDCREIPDFPAASTRVCDLTSPEAVRDLFSGLRERHGTVDILVHCAGINRDAVLWKMSADSWRDVLAANLDSAFYLLKEAVPLMRVKGGAIVLVSSINGERGKFGQANYSASKAGIIGLARTAARELGRFGIRVNVLEPGMIRTPMTASLPPEVVAEAERESVLGRIGEPEDVAAGILFLGSGMSRHITGQILRVDGGQLIA